MGIDIKMTGAADLAIALEHLVSDIRTKVVKSALMAAAKPIVRQAQANAPILKKNTKYRTRGLMKALTAAFTSKIDKARGIIGVYIKPKSKSKSHRKSKGLLDPFYYRFVVQGHVTRGKKAIAGGKSSRNYARASLLSAGKIRSISGNDFLGRALASKSKEAVDIFTEGLAKRIAKANQRKP